MLRSNVGFDLKTDFIGSCPVEFCVKTEASTCFTWLKLTVFPFNKNNFFY